MSQGSELGEVLVLRPPTPAPVCTREPGRTGLTRARHQVTRLASAFAVREAVSSGSVRRSGLAERLREWAASHLWTAGLRCGLSLAATG